MDNLLRPPCAYQGGKQRIASKIVDVIFEQNNIDNNTRFYDLCCGSGSISLELIKRGILPNNITMVDKSPWGLFYKMVGNGSFSTDIFEECINNIPKDVTLIKDYVQSMSKEYADDSVFGSAVYKFLILQACAFGSSATWIEDFKWKKSGGFRNYWLPTETSNRRSPVNPMMPMPKSLLERVHKLCNNLNGIIGHYDFIKDIKIKESSIVYIDPPYKGTAYYGYDVGSISELIKGINNCKIYVSESYSLTDDSLLISSSRKKGGINGERKTNNEEWLSMFDKTYK